MLQNSEKQTRPYDVFVIGGGVNGCGIARDAAGRGLYVGLTEMNDIGSATSSASTKLFHGGLRYLEYFDFKLVRESLSERDNLLLAMPHISWPMRFVFPLDTELRFEEKTPASRILKLLFPWMNGRRPIWIMRGALKFYDRLGGAHLLPKSKLVDLREDEAGENLKVKFSKALEFSDCWIDDSRLVVLNARDAYERGANIQTRTKFTFAKPMGSLWEITLKDLKTGKLIKRKTKALVNATGPWVNKILENSIAENLSNTMRLVKGSHIVTKALFSHKKAYFFQNSDSRVIFAIPYENDFTLIGTTEVDHPEPENKPECSIEEAQYLISFASKFFKHPLTTKDILWSYSGVRPLFDKNEKSANAVTRDYTIKLENNSGKPPLLNVFGGKITTYRKLSENAVNKLTPFFPKSGPSWTKGAPLPGGDFLVKDFDNMVKNLSENYSFLDDFWAKRLVRAYGTLAWDILGTSKHKKHLGIDFGKTLTEVEVRWLAKHEFTTNTEDLIWRRSKLGLRLSQKEVHQLDTFFEALYEED